MKRETDIVLSYVPAILVELVSGKRDLPPWGDMVEGTLVMADVSGFTTMSERLAEAGQEGAERLTAIINRFFGSHLDSAREFRGETLTFGGDAILLLFRHTGHADRAIAAGTKMLGETQRMPSVDVPGGKVKLGMSVGAHSGTFLLAAAGLPEERMQLFVLGHSAARVAAAEAQAERGELVVSADTADLVRHPWLLQDVGGWFNVVAPRGRPYDGQCSEPNPPDDDLVRRLLSFTPPSVRDAVQSQRDPEIMPPEHRRVSVVFVQVLGLNDVLEAEGPKAAIEELQRYVSHAVALAAKHRGFLVSTDIDPRGFKLILTFGAPVAHEFAAANAARFALELEELVKSETGRLTQRIGINGGPVFAGDVGPAWRRQYTVMGDEVNLAARLMSSAEPGTILAARSWADQVGPEFCVGDRSPVRVKGKAQTIPVCVLREESATKAEPEQSTTPLFGRKEELALFRRLWGEVIEGRGKTFVVKGEPGVGKSRLLDEAVRGTVGGASVLRASCQEHLQGIPFVPWVQLLSHLLQLDGEVDSGARTAAVGEAVERLAPGMIEFRSLLNPLLSLDFPPSEVVSSLDGQARRERLFELVTRLFTAECPAQGRVLLIRDIHWGDDSSRALMNYFGDRIGHARLMLVVSTRASEDPPELASFAEILALRELSREDSLELMRHTLSVPDLPETVADTVHAKTRGNPLFLEEVVHSLRAPGVLEKILSASSVARASELASLAIPDRVQGLLMSRLDMLPIDEREILKVAAVVGREFQDSVLAGLPSFPMDSSSVSEALGDLYHAGLIASTGRGPETGSGTFRFRQALLQEVVYESLPYSRRREIHEEVAEFLEAASDQPDQGLLVHHYRHAGNKERLRISAARAAESSQEVYAYREAIDYLGIAMETVQAPTSSEGSIRSRFEELAGDCLESLARHQEAVENYLQARRRWASPHVRAAAVAALAEIAPLSDPEARGADLCRKIGVSLERQHTDYRRALRWLYRAEEALPPGRTALASRLQVTRGVIHFRLGRFEEALAYGERGLTLARADGDDALQAYALAMLVNPLVGLGLLQRSIETCLEAVTRYERAGDLAGQASSHGNLAACYQLVGDLRASVTHQEICLELNQRLAYHTGVSIAHNNMAEVLLLLGRTEEAIRHLEEVVNRWEERKMPPALVGFASVNLSRALLRMEEPREARRVLEEGRSLLVHAQARGLLIDADLQDAQMLLAEGHLNEARIICHKVLEAARESGAKVSEVQGLGLLGRLELTCKNLKAAEGHLQCSLELAEAIGADYERGLALLTLSELYMLGSPRISESYSEPLAQAIALFQAMGAEYDLKRACELRDRCWPSVLDSSTPTVSKGGT